MNVASRAWRLRGRPADSGASLRLKVEDESTSGEMSAETKLAVGFIGLGRMGGAMVAHLARAGFTVRAFVGGDQMAYERLRPVLEATADPQRIVHCGPSGTGQAVKACNQLGTGLTEAALLEAVFAGMASGASIEAIIQGVGGDDGWRKRIGEIASQGRGRGSTT